VRSKPERIPENFAGNHAKTDDPEGQKASLLDCHLKPTTSLDDPTRSRPRSKEKVGMNFMPAFLRFSARSG
jgi:hypothetical protein